jgi:predicted RNA-binding Zn-ribbon protein involved in translation (DUF1610 family)
VSREEAEEMECPNCGQEMDCIDTTYSNTGIIHGRVNPSHTGDIYKCPNEDCENENSWLDNFITKRLEPWRG